MNNKQIIIDAPEGKVIDIEHFNQTGNVRFIDETPKKIEFPKEWELKEGDNYYIDNYSIVADINVQNNELRKKNKKNSLPSKSLADQMLIFKQLIYMRERYREIEKLNNPELGEIDWANDQPKSCIVVSKNKLLHIIHYDVTLFFSFQLSETRDEFAKNFGDMILQCKDILG